MEISGTTGYDIYYDVQIAKGYLEKHAGFGIVFEKVVMSRFLFFIFGWIIFLALASILIHISQPGNTLSGPEQFEIATLVRDNPVIQKVQQAYQSEDFVTALQLIDQHETEFSDLPKPNHELGFHFYHLKGHVHSSIWQHIEAEESWQKALSYTSNKRFRKRLLRLIEASRHVIHDLNDERDLRDIYQASPYVGPASALKGKVVVIYIFLTDGALQGWSMRKRDFVMNNWAFAEHWMQMNAKKYRTDLDFVHRLFMVNKNPYIKRLKVGDFNKKFVNADKVAQLAAENFGFKNIMSFVEEIKKQEKADQAILMLHLARDGRSFASRCMFRCQSDAEYVFLMEKPNAKFWQSMGYAQAHEALHLFGADDLYNIQKAKYYAVRDIMNYPSSVLDASTIDDITAYAIGLTDNKPKTPFKIKDYSPGRE